MANNLVKGSSMRQKLQNSKGYAESPEFPALGLFILIRSLVHWITHYFLYTHTHIHTHTYTHTHTHTYIYRYRYRYTDTKSITLPCSLVCAGNEVQHYKFEVNKIPSSLNIKFLVHTTTYHVQYPYRHQNRSNHLVAHGIIKT